MTTPQRGRGGGAAAISVRGLRQSYGDFEAVRDVSFEVGRGELYALLGTNGAGKTTVIETLEGFRRPGAGAVRVFGIDPYGQPAALRERVDAVLQNSGQFPELTVRETVDLARDLCADPMGTAEVLAITGLEEQAGVVVRQLSGGQRRRLDLGTALLSRPEALFLDEPTAGMDPAARRAAWEVVSGAVRGGAAVVLTTHYLEEAERLADRIGIMHRGRMHVSGTLRSIVAERGDRIGFALPDGVRAGDLPALEGAQPDVELRGARAWVGYTVHGGDTELRAHRALAALVAWAERFRTGLPLLEVRPATLEDAFLSVADSTRELAEG